MRVGNWRTARRCGRRSDGLTLQRTGDALTLERTSQRFHARTQRRTLRRSDGRSNAPALARTLQRFDGRTQRWTFGRSDRRKDAATTDRTPRAMDERTTVQRQSQRDMSRCRIVRTPKNGSFQGRLEGDARGNQRLSKHTEFSLSGFFAQGASGALLWLGRVTKPTSSPGRP